MTYDAAAAHDGAIPHDRALRHDVAHDVAPHLHPVLTHRPVLIDCDTCSVRGIGCGDCVVTVLLGGPPDGVTLNDDERRAVEVLAAAGLVPPLRLVHGIESEVVDPSGV